MREVSRERRGRGGVCVCVGGGQEGEGRNSLQESVVKIFTIQIRCSQCEQTRSQHMNDEQICMNMSAAAEIKER